MSENEDYLVQELFRLQNIIERKELEILLLEQQIRKLQAKLNQSGIFP